MRAEAPSRKKLTGKEYQNLRGHGGGDGLPQNPSVRRRIPISSSSKLNANGSKDEILKLKLETALAEVRPEKQIPTKTWIPINKQFLQKSASVAEITPTKTTKERLLIASTEVSSVKIYATPRPLNPKPKKMFCSQERNSCRIYRRLMLLAWRRSRAIVKELKGKTEKQQIQIVQLELQINVISQLRISESQKRKETQSECLKLRQGSEFLEIENGQLIESLQNCREMVKNELKVAKAENNFLSDQSTKMQEIISKKNSEKKLLQEKIMFQADEISNQKELLQGLQDKLKLVQKSLKIVEANYEIQEKKYAKLKCEFQKQLDKNTSVMKQLRSLQEEKITLSLKTDRLEMQLTDYIRSCEELKDENAELKQEVYNMSIELMEEQKHNWVQKTKHFTLLSLSALEKIAHVVITFYLDNHVSF
ncbi:early endosome antigen 1-like [Euwallacea similis]|uniref:early endosome antigen 1-like n=1 Tax=Euwallacea similis TaxID=1736056 RepID=UPI00344FF052